MNYRKNWGFQESYVKDIHNFIVPNLDFVLIWISQRFSTAKSYRIIFDFKVAVSIVDNKHIYYFHVIMHLMINFRYNGLRMSSIN